MDEDRQDRIRGAFIGAVAGDALGMPLEFGPPSPPDQLVRDMRLGPLPAGTFTDDTEMALALADSLLHHLPLDPVDLAGRFADWHRHGPRDVGIYTSQVLMGVNSGLDWETAVENVRRAQPDNAANGSLMRCWPVALACWPDLPALVRESRLQSRVTHPHPECQAACAFTAAVIALLIQGHTIPEAIEAALEWSPLPAPLLEIVRTAGDLRREDLPNTGWVRHTLQSALWGLLTTDSFEECVVQVANLGADADTAAAVAGALAGAAYGLEEIPSRWVEALRGEWPIHSGQVLRAPDLIALADRLGSLTPLS